VSDEVHNISFSKRMLNLEMRFVGDNYDTA
jgi:hypothetical protein